MRIVLLSDTSKDFPDNTNSAFKVRLPEPLHLEDGPWQVGLISLSMPDVGLNLDTLTGDRTANLIETTYVLNRNVLKWATVSMAEVADHFTIIDGVKLMKIIVGQLQ